MGAYLKYFAFIFLPSLIINLSVELNIILLYSRTYSELSSKFCFSLKLLSIIIISLCQLTKILSSSKYCITLTSSIDLLLAILYNLP